MSIGQIVRKKRESLRLTLDEVCHKASFSKPYLSTIETDKVKNPPSDEILLKLEEILGFEPGLLVHIAHMERMPSDIRSKYESVEAENQKLRQFIKNLISKKTDSTQINRVLKTENINLDISASDYSAGKLIPIINKPQNPYPDEKKYLNFPSIAQDYVRCPDLHAPNAFAISVIDDSMETKYKQNNIVIFSPEEKITKGSDCFIILTEKPGPIFKRVFFESDNKIRLQPRNEKYPPLTIDKNNIAGMYRAVMKCEKINSE